MQQDMWDDKDSIYRECRSLVIDLDEEEIVICPFKKFFNLNEVEENNINKVINEIHNAKTFEITNKLDGSMQCTRFYNNKIIMTGSMNLDIKNSWRLQDGISMLTENHKMMIKDNPNYTFIFEYISLKDAHVVIYNKSQEGLYLIGIRNVYTGEELSYNNLKYFANKYNIPMTDIEHIQFDEMLKQMKLYKSSDKEGWVLNIDGRKVKVKCDDYVHLHRILDKLSSINVIIENVAEDRFDDMMSKIPNTHKDRVLQTAKEIIDYKNKANKLIKEYYNKAPKNNTKEFMIWVDNNCPDYIKSHVKNIYLGKEYNILKTRCGYKKYNDIIKEC